MSARRGGRWCHHLVLSISVVGALTTHFFCVSSASGQTTIDFENLPAGIIVDFQYAAPPYGVLIQPVPGVIVADPPKAHSGSRVLQPTHGEFYTGPFVITFKSGQSHVSLFAGAAVSAPNLTVQGTLRAFDAVGNQLAQDGPKLTVPNACATAFDVKVPKPTIARIEIYLESIDQNGLRSEVVESIDDLSFKGNAPPPVANVAPIVKITAPLAQEQLDATLLLVQGTVTGSGLLPTALLTLDTQQAPNEPHLPPFVSALPLGGQGAVLSFATSLKLGLGPQILTVGAENDAGLKGSAQVQFTNLPAAITNRFALSGGAAALGNLNWVVAGGGCTLAVYDKAAVSSESGVTRVIRGDIFGKWLQWILAKYDQLYVLGVRSFCPIEEERDALGSSRAQTFHAGRIYAQLADGPFYVPEVFAEAVNLLGGEVATGVPLSDPTSSPAAQTWLFQQFVRPGKSGMPSTLEIKGSPAVLWVERQGGDLTALVEAGLSLTAASPTVAEQFPCAANEGPCTVSSPSSPPGISNADPFCPNEPGGGLTPEWGAVLSNYSMTTLVGFVVASYFSDLDLPTSHEYSNDWNVIVQPIHPFKSLLANNRNMEVEFEEYFEHYFFVLWDPPQKGDLYLAAGRWIIDCGHPSFYSEIHPPFATADVRTERGGAGPKTLAYIWVNGFYTGDPLDIDLFPPPRPRPNAFLFVNKPIDAQAAWGVQPSFTTDPDFFAYVRPHFTASPRRVSLSILGSGEMLWQGGREYAGRWEIGWETENQYQVVHLNNKWWP